MKESTRGTLMFDLGIPVDEFKADGRKVIVLVVVNQDGTIYSCDTKIDEAELDMTVDQFTDRLTRPMTVSVLSQAAQRLKGEQEQGAIS
jgi:hypothetical protein